ncbi:MAG: RagB/SusD family nutrient uptake outer membrane protein [Bacteroidales bacterium]|nr:RagB/SusD family nutrient uptake outer membrane protein [Parabacteroides sp.]MDY5622932.1 RagB/SusD family nutrient uptake outer membrane protein [Bacteroidales bacterium]
MKKIFKQYILALACASMLLTACTSDFLDEVNPNQQTPSTFWTSEENVEKGLSAVYNPIRRKMYGYYGGFESALHYQMRADDCYPVRGEEAMIWEVLSFTNTPNTGTGLWGYIYTGIQLANEFLYNAPNVKMDQAKLDQMLGEAYFMRGFWYFRVRTDFNEGVIRLLPSSIDNEAYGLSTPEEVLDQAIADLTEAKKRLPETRPTGENGRVTKYAAQAMLGKALLWKGDYAAAKTELEAVMNSGHYDLVADYEDNFRDDTEFNQESIWEIVYEPIGNANDSWGNSTGDNAFMGSALAHFFGPSLKGEGVTGQNLGGGWYKMSPSPYLIEQYMVEPRPEGSDTKWDKRLYTTCFFKYSDYGDVKEDDTFFDGFTFDEIFNWTASPSGDDKYGIAKAGTSPAYPKINGKEGRFLFKKLTCWWNPTGCTMYTNNAGRIANYRIMRFAEVLFLHAEACLETGDNTAAMADINRIRLRAGLPEKQLGSKDAIMEELRNQKLLEFAGENIRWDDLVRWYSYDELKRIMSQRKTDSMVWKLSTSIDAEGNEKVTYTPTGEIKDTQGFSTNFQKKHMYFPIPQSEVDANMNLEQKIDWQ